jgi:hypothetical protein
MQDSCGLCGMAKNGCTLCSFAALAHLSLPDSGFAFFNDREMKEDERRSCSYSVNGNRHQTAPTEQTRCRTRKAHAVQSFLRSDVAVTFCLHTLCIFAVASHQANQSKQIFSCFTCCFHSGSFFKTAPFTPVSRCREGCLKNCGSSLKS